MTRSKTIDAIGTPQPGLQLDYPALSVRDTGTARGRGVFALRPFKAGETVESVQVLVLKTDFDDLPLLLRTYVFDWESLAGVPNAHAVALGFGSMYNHDDPASLSYAADARESILRFVATRDIIAGEELTINYNAESGVAEASDDSWFERHGIELIVRRPKPGARRRPSSAVAKRGTSG